MSPRVVRTAAGGALFLLAPLLLLLSGRTSVVTSADEGAAARPLWTAVAPVAAGLLLARLVPPRLPDLRPALWPGLERETRSLVAIAVAFPLCVFVVGG